MVKWQKNERETNERKDEAEKHGNEGEKRGDGEEGLHDKASTNDGENKTRYPP